MAKTAFSHVGVVCEDPIKTEWSYARHFSFRKAMVYAPEPVQVVMIKSSGMHLDLFKADQDRPDSATSKAGPGYPCFRHVCFLVTTSRQS